MALLLLLLSDDDDSLSTRQYNDLNHRLLYNTPTDNSNTSTNEQQSYLELLQSKIKESTIDIIDSDISPSKPLPTYNIKDAVDATQNYANSVGILIYRPDDDDFVLLYNERSHRWVSACSKLSISFTNFIVMLRQEFPERLISLLCLLQV